MIKGKAHSLHILVCRVCGGGVTEILDLGMSPPANRLALSPSDPIDQYPLGLSQCQSCGLVQNSTSLSTALLFEADYPYLSSVSKTVQNNAAELARKIAAHVPKNAKALDIGSNDGTTQLAIESLGIPCFGVDPAANAVAIARQRGCRTHCGPFDRHAVDMIYREMGGVDVVVMSNVLAHVPDPAKLLTCVMDILNPGGLVVIEVQSWRDLVSSGAFDMVYHEHHSHFSLTTLLRLIETAGLVAVSVDETSAQGGSIRLWCQRGSTHSVTVLQLAELESGQLEGAATHLSLSVESFRAAAKDFGTTQAGRSIAGYGAAAKTVTLLASCKSHLGMTCIADNAPSKMGRYLPLYGVPIISPEQMLASDPDVIILFAWNYAEEILPTLGDREIWAPIPEFRRIN